MALWKTTIGQGTSRRTQKRITEIRVTEKFGLVDFSVRVSSPTTAERAQIKGRTDAAIIQIKRGTDILVEGFIEDVELGGSYITYTGRCFLILLGYSTASTTSSGGDGETDAEFTDKTGTYIIQKLIGDYCHSKDPEISSSISFKDIYGIDVEYEGEVKLHGKKVYQIVREMCQSYGHDLWSMAFWSGDNVTHKVISVGEKSRGDSGNPESTLRGGVHFKDIPVVRYKSSRAINCLRVIGGGTGKDKVSEFVEDSASIAAIGHVEGEPYHSNMIRSVATAQSVGEAIINAKKDPVEEISVDLAVYVNDLRYGDWVRVVDRHSGLDTIKRIKSITQIYNINSADSMSLEFGDKFDNYENIINDLTKGDVDDEPEMTYAGGSLRITANDPPSTYVRIDGGNWYGTDGILHNYGNTIRTFWGGNPPYNATTVGNFFKALVQIKDGATSSTDIIYTTSLTVTAHTGYSKDFAKAEVIASDPGYTPIGELILRCSSTGGAISDVTALDEGGSFIYRDARPIVGSSASGFGGEGRWALTTDDAWTASTAYTVGAWVGPTVVNSRSYKCTTAGTSGATEPTWGVVLGATTADGGVAWTCYYDGIVVDPIAGITNLDIHVTPIGAGVVYLG